jgi:hypothetical protein
MTILKLEIVICMIWKYQLDETFSNLIQQPDFYVELEVPIIRPRTLTQQVFALEQSSITSPIGNNLSSLSKYPMVFGMPWRPTAAL